MKKYEDDLREHSNEVRNLKKKIKTRDDRIEELEYDLNDANETIDELEDKVSELQKIVDYFAFGGLRNGGRAGHYGL